MKRYLLNIWWGLLLCLAVGCASLGVSDRTEIRLYETAGDQSPPTTPDSLVCVSYNIEFAEEMAQALADLKSAARSRRPDILLLQEMDAAGVAFLADSLRLNSVYFPSYRHAHHGRLFGTAVLSPWPLSSPQHEVLPHANPLSENRRTALAVDVHIGERVVRAVSVHLSTLVVGLDGRVEQAQVVRDSLVADNGPAIIGGDYNSGTDWETLLFRRVARQAGFREALLPDGKTADGGPLDWVGYDLKLDHIYYRELEFVRAGIMEDAAASDHYPVWAVFRWDD